jgi:hypothetical protein
LSRSAGPLVRAPKEVDLRLLAHDQVLEQVLERLGSPLTIRGLDRRLERVDGLRLAGDQPLNRLDGRRSRAALARSWRACRQTIFSIKRRASASSLSP